MGERVYVVRHGAVRGAGAYYYDGTFGTNAKLAARLDEEAARRLVRTWPGRVVRLVTLSEQLRRAKKRIAELEQHVPVCHTAFHEGEDEGYKKGRADERAAVVGWLLRKCVTMNQSEALRYAVTMIESGEHVKEHKR